MSFYLKPPRGVVTYRRLEMCVQQRLLFYDKIEDKHFEIDNFDCLIEDCGLDRTGHYMLRLYAHSRPNFRFKFIQNEQKLLLLRLDTYDQSDVKRFLRQLLKHCRDVLQESISDTIEEILLFLEQLALDMLNCDFLNHIFHMTHINSKRCSKIFFSAPFEYCYSLIGNREFDLFHGNVKIDCKNWKRLIISVYGIYLKAVLNQMQMNIFVEDTLSDIRIRKIMEAIKQSGYESYGKNMRNKDRFDISRIKEKSIIFPLCMKSLYMSLERTNRLAHNERFDFSLFLKGIGLKMEDALRFWEEMYSKQHSSCSKCTHSWQKNERKYIYGIRHLYGFEGSRKNYQARSCKYLQEKTLGPIEDGGCPFTHFDDQNLKRLLETVLPDDNENIEVIIHKRNKDPNISCKLLFDTLYKNLTNSQATCENKNLQNPCQYYLLLKDSFRTT